MKHISFLAVKCLVISAVSLIVLGIYTDLDMQQILALSLAVVVTSYLIGDLLILSVFNNTVAAVADAGLAWLLLYLGNYIWTDSHISLISSLTAAAIIGIGEILLHPLMENNLPARRQNGLN